MMDGGAAVEVDFLEVIALGGNDGPGGIVGIKIIRVIAGHAAQHSDRVGGKGVLVRDAPHGFKVVAGLQLPPGNKHAVARLGGSGWATGGVVRVREIGSVLL